MKTISKFSYGNYPDLNINYVIQLYQRCYCMIP